MNQKLEVLLDQLFDDDEDVYGLAITEIAEKVKANPGIIDIVVHRLEVESDFYRLYRLLDVLRESGGSAVRALEALKKVLFDREKDNSIRSYASAILRQLGGVSEPIFLEAIQSDDLLCQAALDFVRVSPRVGQELLALTISLLRSENTVLGDQAGLALVKHVKASDKAERIFFHAEPIASCRFAKALLAAAESSELHLESAGDQSQLIDLLGQYVSDDNPMVRECASGALAATNCNVDSIIPALIESLHDRNAPVVTGCAMALSRATVNMYGVVDALCDALSFESSDLQVQWRTRTFVAWSLGMIGVEASKAVKPILNTFAETPSLDWLEEVIWALKRILPHRANLISRIAKTAIGKLSGPELVDQLRKVLLAE